MASPFGREELLLRTPLTFGFSAPSNTYQPRNDHVTIVREDFSAGGSREQQRAKIRRMSRNTPHTARVKAMRGLTDDPICSVEDNKAQPRPMSALTNRDLSDGYRPPGSSRYSANSSKQLYAVGVVPVTYAWRDELMKKAQKAISKALWQDKQPGSHSTTRPLSRQSSRGLPRQFDHLDDKTLLDMMCQILHTDSIPRCQEWMNNAPDDQKDIVLNMIRLAALGEEGHEDLPTRPPSKEHRYMWQPRQSRHHSDPLMGDSLDLLSLNSHPRYLFSQTGDVGGAGGDKLKALGLPRIAQTPRELAMSESHSGKGGRQGKLRRSQSHDVGTQLDELETDVYKTIAARTVMKNNKQRHKGKKKQKQKSGHKASSSDDTTELPSLHLRQQVVKHQRPRSKSAGGAESIQHRVKGDRREGEVGPLYTSHWKS